ncbi:MAG: hypothetical protein WCS73_06985 [Lentisphaeria bacterium]
MNKSINELSSEKNADSSKSFQESPIKDEQTVYTVQHAALSDTKEAAASESSVKDEQKVCTVQHAALSDKPYTNVKKTLDLPTKDEQTVYTVQYETLNYLSMAADIEKGIIPTSLDDLAAMGSSLLSVGAKTRQTIAVAIAVAKQSLPLKKWIDWADIHFHQNTQSRSHFAAVGTLLLYIKKNHSALYTGTFRLDFEKIYCLTQIEDNQVGGFITRYHLADMSRESVRVAVCEFIGKPVQEATEARTLLLPGFEDLLDSVVSADDSKVAGSITSSASAIKALTAGSRIMEAGIAHQFLAADVDGILTAKGIVLHELKDIEEIIKKLEKNG